MFQFISKSTLKQRVVLLLVLILAVLLVLKYADISIAGLPLPSVIREQEQLLSSRQKTLLELKKERQAKELALTKLQQQAESFWKVAEQSPSVAVPTEFKKLARDAQTNPQQIGAPRMNKVLDLNHVREVEFNVRLTAPMREVTRLLAQMEKSEKNFYWNRCNINPDNPRSPKQVTVNGRVKALVLSAETSRFLSGKSGTMSGAPEADE